MSSVRTTAKDILESNGYSTQNIDGLVAQATATYVRELTETLGEMIMAAERVVTGLESAVLGHHGVAKSDAKKYTLAQFKTVLAEYDHSTCPISKFDEATQTLKKGCPIAVENFKKANNA